MWWIEYKFNNEIKDFEYYCESILTAIEAFTDSTGENANTITKATKIE